MRRLAVLLLLISVACRYEPQPAETKTGGNATDRNPVTGTTGTGQPTSPATQSAQAAQQLSTAPPQVTGTEVVHGASTETTSTLSGPNSTTAAISTPTATTATVKTDTGAQVIHKKKQ